MITDPGILRISADVQSVLAANQPVVALESTVIAHGLPRPQNLQTALRLEQIVRDSGAVPATIGVLDGIARVGFSQLELERLASTAGQKTTVKVSRRDLPFVVGMVCSQT